MLDIREAIIEDIEIMYKWWSEGDYNFCGELIDTDTNINNFVATLQHEIKNRRQEYTILAFDGINSFGMLWADFVYDTNKKTYISMYIDKKHRNSMKLIYFLLEGTKMIFKKCNKSKIYCEISPNNLKMIDIAKKLNFKFIKVNYIENNPLNLYSFIYQDIEKFKKKYSRIFKNTTL